MTRKPIFPTPPSPSLAAVMGGGIQGGGARPAVPGGGGVNPTSMAQNDIIIMGLLVEKLFRAKFCVPAPLAPTSVLTQNKGPDMEPHFSNPPPPRQSNFQVAQTYTGHQSSEPNMLASLSQPYGEGFSRADGVGDSEAGKRAMRERIPMVQWGQGVHSVVCRRGR